MPGKTVNRTLTTGLLVVGAALLALGSGVLIATSGTIGNDDVRRAVAPLATVALGKIQDSPAGVTIDVNVPSDEKWLNLVKTLGDEGVVIVAVKGERPGGETYGLSDLGISLDIRRAGNTIACVPEGQPPYGYSATAQMNGLRCDASPGDRLTIHAKTASSRPLPGAQLAVFARWEKASVIDATEALSIAGSVRPAALIAALFGGGLVVFALWRRRAAPSRS